MCIDLCPVDKNYVSAHVGSLGIERNTPILVGSVTHGAWWSVNEKGLATHIKRHLVSGPCIPSGSGWRMSHLCAKNKKVIKPD